MHDEIARLASLEDLRSPLLQAKNDQAYESPEPDSSGWPDWAKEKHIAKSDKTLMNDSLAYSHSMGNMDQTSQPSLCGLKFL